MKPNPDRQFSLLVTGSDAVQMGVIAAAARVTLTELPDQHCFLEDAFMRISGHDVQYTAGGTADATNSGQVLAQARS